MNIKKMGICALAVAMITTSSKMAFALDNTKKEAVDEMAAVTVQSMQSTVATELTAEEKAKIEKDNAELDFTAIIASDEMGETDFTASIDTIEVTKEEKAKMEEENSKMDFVAVSASTEAVAAGKTKN